jgi:hypothetical protein
LARAGNSVFPERPVLMDPSDFFILEFSGVLDPESLRIGRGGAVPAIVMPTRRKQFFEGIGYSMPEADEAARALLLDHLAKKTRGESLVRAKQ